MGVRGLTTFISQNDRKYLKTHKLHDTYVIIDGNGLACQLFVLNGSRVFMAFGGDYDRYAQYVQDFFQMLAQCNVKPIVVFDGGYEKKKLKTVINRLRDRAAMLKHVKPASNSAPVVFPLLMRQVFRQVLLAMNVPIVQCDFEADQEIAALGRKYNCPVISYDSDYFIYDVEYIPIPTIEHEARPLTFSLGTPSNKLCVHCKIFRVEHFLDSFGGMDKAMLPLLSALLGNDYVKLSVFRKFHSQLKTLKGKKTSIQKRVARVIQWLRNEKSFDSALQSILGRMKTHCRPLVLRKIKETINIYKCDKLTVENYLPSELINSYSSPLAEPPKVDINEMIEDANLGNPDVEIDEANFSEESSEELEDSELESNDEEEEEVQLSDIEDDRMEVDDGTSTNKKTQVETHSKIPDWLLDQCRRGLMDTSVFDILTLKTCFSTPQIEDKSLTPSHEVSFPLLQAVTKIILGCNNRSISYWARNRNGFIQKYHLQPSNIDLPQLENIVNCPPESRKTILLNLLNVPSEFCIEVFPDEWKLYLCTILYWVKNTTSPLITENHVKSLCLCLIALNIIDKKLGFIREKLSFLKKCGKTLKRLLKTQQTDLESDDLEDEMKCNSNSEEIHDSIPTDCAFRNLLSSVSVDDCVVSFESFLKLHKLREDLKSDTSLFSYPDIHAFAQFQNCLHYAMVLNSLLLFPFKQCSVHNFYSGTFIYNACSALNECKNIDEPIHNLFANSPKLLDVFTALVTVISTATPPAAVQPKKCRQRKRKRSRKHKTENISEADDSVKEPTSDANEEEYHDENNIFSLLLSV